MGGFNVYYVPRRTIGSRAGGRPGCAFLLSAAHQRILTGRKFFPNLISGPFYQGLVVVFAVAAGLSAIAARTSLLRGGRCVPA